MDFSKQEEAPLGQSWDASDEGLPGWLEAWGTPPHSQLSLDLMIIP